MAGGKLPPRQKMIGMMYLVLTALLALNVSKDILDAFVIVNDGLENTKVNFKNKNESQYTEFLKSYNENPVKVKPFWDKAQEVQKAAENLVSYIDSIKANIIYQTEGYDNMSQVIGKGESGQDTVLSMKYIASKDNYDIPTNLLIGAEPHAPKEGNLTALELKNKLADFRDRLKQMVEPGSALDKALDKAFNFDDRKDASGTEEKWEASNFYHVPLAASVTILSKIQTDVRNAESDAVKYLYSSVDAGSFKFNKLEAAVISPSNYIVLGDTFRADVFLAAFDSTKNPVIRLGSGDYQDSVKFAISGDTVPIDVINGKGRVRIPTRSEGEYTWQGVINFEAPGGRVLPFPFKTQYTVAKPSLVVSADKMNVFYRGVDNPVSISVPGVPADKIVASINNGSLRKTGKGNYVVNVKQGKDAVISVQAEMPDGSKRNMGKMEFRVKVIPNPVPYVAQKTGSDNVSLPQLKATNKIFARMENFDFDLEPQIIGFTFSMSLAGGVLVEEKVDGDRFNETVRNLIEKLKRNQKVYFENILVKMPDGTTRPIGPVILKAT